MWREALESKGFKLGRSESEYMECKNANNKELVTIAGEEVAKRPISLP